LPLMYVRVRSHLKRINFPVLCYVRSFVWCAGVAYFGCC
jgi:hypothetical protein